MLQAAGDLGLEQEASAAGRVVGVAVEDLLEGHLAVELAVERHEDRPEAPLGVGPQHPEPSPVGAGCVDRRIAVVTPSPPASAAAPA